MPVRRPLDLRAIGGVLVLCVVWGIQQVALKGVAANAAPVMQLAIRFGGASLFFGLWVFFCEGNRAFTDGTLPSGLLLGLLFSLEFIFAGQASRSLGSAGGRWWSCSPEICSLCLGA